MKQVSTILFFSMLLLSCNTPKSDETRTSADKTIDTLTYAYKAIYSSDVQVPSKPEIGRMVLVVWKMFENKKIDSLKKYYADTVTYENYEGYRFHGPADSLLNYARKDVQGLDSLRFDISMWQSLHLNDRNEDWVYIWATERRYEKGGKADTSLIHEQWKVENGRVSYFNQYVKKPSRK
jgi:hypothetical protein